MSLASRVRPRCGASLRRRDYYLSKSATEGVLDTLVLGPDARDGDDALGDRYVAYSKGRVAVEDGTAVAASAWTGRGTRDKNLLRTRFLRPPQRPSRPTGPLVHRGLWRFFFALSRRVFLSEW